MFPPRNPRNGAVPVCWRVGTVLKGSSIGAEEHVERFSEGSHSLASESIQAVVLMARVAIAWAPAEHGEREREREREACGLSMADSAVQFDTTDYAKDVLSRLRMSRRMQIVVILSVLTLGRCCCHVQAQERGFYSIDCGSAATENYTDPTTTIVWTPDSGIMMEGVTETVVAPTTDTGDVFTTLRYFPGNQSKYCYSLAPVVTGGFYIVRASFWMGTTAVYPTQANGQVSFQFIIDAYVAADVTVEFPQTYPAYRELYVMANTSSMSACVARTATSTGLSDPPFITGLELRPLPAQTYGGLVVGFARRPLLKIARTDFAASSSFPNLRYPDDTLDRIWYRETTPYALDTTLTVSTTSSIDKVPEQVVQTSFDDIGLVYTSVESKQHLYMHTLYFAEINTSVDAIGQRVFDVASNGDTLLKGLDVYAQVGAFKAFEMVNITSTSVGWVNITFTSTLTSTNKPFIAGFELFQFLDDPIPLGTFISDDVAIQAFVGNLTKLSGYKGDPCLPSDYKFPWLTCSIATPTRIVTIDLSNYDLGGEVPASINDLTELTTISLSGNNLQGGIPDLTALTDLEFLDLSDNNLTGPIPESLATLPKLKTLYLQNNDLSGVIPPALQQKTSLDFKYTGNKYLCESTDSNCVMAPSPLATPPPPPPAQSPSSSPAIGIIVGVVVAVVILLVVAIIMAVRCCSKSSNPVLPTPPPTNPIVKHRSPPSTDAQTPPIHVAEVFSYNDISLATNNFSHILGRGGFGPVYRGTLLDGRAVAIKVLSEEKSQGEAEFKNEANLLSTVHHRKIVQLFGYCVDGILALVYELMPRGSLYDALFGPRAITSPLSWRERLSIITDAAQGLDYLHHQCVNIIIHRDVKSSNILLGKNLEGKIADLGISRDKDAATTRLMGTFGYLDPEYAMSLRLTPMVDVFSFGVVLFEVITGKLPVMKTKEGQDVRLVDWVQPLVEDGDLEQLVDSRLKEQYDVNAMRSVIDIAMRCVRFKSSERPRMGEVYNCVARALNNEVERDSNPPHSSRAFSEASSSSGPAHSMPPDIVLAR